MLGWFIDFFLFIKFSPQLNNPIAEQTCLRRALCNVSFHDSSNWGAERFIRKEFKYYFRMVCAHMLENVHQRVNN